jgi:hypothetical protein
MDSIRSSTLTLALVALVALAGCQMMGSGEREAPGPVPPPPNDAEPRGDVDASAPVPRTSEIAREGLGGLSYQPDRDGVIYLYDVDDERVVDRKMIRGGERYTFDPKRDIATIDGQIVTERQINDRHRHRLYFDPGARIRVRGDERVSGDDRVSREEQPRGEERVTGDERISRPAPQPERALRVPRSAVLVAEGRDRLTYRADRAGTVYVRDEDRDRVLYSGQLLRNERVAVEPGRQRITINDRAVHEQDIRDGDQYRIYFEPN